MVSTGKRVLFIKHAAGSTALKRNLKLNDAQPALLAA